MGEQSGLDLRATIRAAVQSIERGGTGDAMAAADVVRAALAARGLAANCHVGVKGLDADRTVEWYAGQFLDIVETQSWFAMNSFINCLDKFAPEASSEARS